MSQFIGAITVLVPDYEAGLAFFSGALGFDIVEDRPQGKGKRFIVVAPPGSTETRLRLAMATTPEQNTTIGIQAGGRVLLFLETDDFDRDFSAYTAAGVTFLEEPRTEDFGKVALFSDPFGGKWELIGRLSR